MYEDPKSKIRQLEKVLDARGSDSSNRVTRHELHNRDIDVNQDWDDSEFKVGEEVFIPKPMKKQLSISVKILFSSIIFFVLALLVVFFKFMGGGNLVSSDNIEITVKAPVSVLSGEVFSFEVEVKNNNDVSLTEADLGISFPTGAKDVVNTILPAKRVQDYIGDILPGQSIKKNISVVLLGNENEKKEINMALEYKVSGSNSLFNKIKTISVLLTSSPVNMVITGPQEVSINQKTDFTIEITSNSPTLMRGVLLKADYPFGFSFIDSSPKTFSKNNLWLIGDLEPGATRQIKFSGLFSGQEGEERGFTFSLGNQAQSDSLVLDSTFISTFSSIVIRRPLVSIDVSFNETNSPEYVSTAGSKVETVITWKNNLTYEVSNLSIVVRLNGNALDKSSVQVDDGYYRSIDNVITFNKTTDSNLAKLLPGDSGSSKFTFSSFGVSSVTGAGLSNPTIVLDIFVNGQRLGYSSGSEEILFSDSRKVKITSGARLFAKALYYVGPFQNSGPIPPKAEQKTTYTVTWTVTNPLNSISNAKVSAALPLYVDWLSSVSSDKEKISYDPESRLITWNIGNISAGAGTVSPAREASFQISFAPSVDQIGTTPYIIKEAVLNAQDNFTQTAVYDVFPNLNTRLSNDPYFGVDSDLVIQ